MEEQLISGTTERMPLYSGHLCGQSLLHIPRMGPSRAAGCWTAFDASSRTHTTNRMRTGGLLGWLSGFDDNCRFQAPPLKAVG